MAAPAIALPYPPSPDPADLPEGLTDYPPSYVAQQNLLLAGLFVFLAFYVGLVLLAGLAFTYCLVTVGSYWGLKVLGLVVAGLAFLFLVKGFFKRHPEDKTLHVEVAEDDQPVLFAFIRQLCDELDAPLPNRVFVSPDVNAAVIPRTTLVNLFVPPEKDLVIGLGLVNCCNLSEFKSVMAHEFGHFGQSATASTYTYVAYRIILDLVEGEDAFDRAVAWARRQEGVVGAVGLTVAGVLGAGRIVLDRVFRAITLQRLVVSREQEFHADLVAVAAAGSEAVVLSLMRLRFGQVCLEQAVEDLVVAMDHDLHTRDLFHHQERAEAVVRRRKKNPALGVRPAGAGPDVRVFDPDEEEVEHDEIPEMRRTHPPAHETEENAKERYVVGVVDDRSPWDLFADAADLRDEVTHLFYRRALKAKRTATRSDPAAVQAFIDAEHADTTYDPKYQGVYDDRVIEPGELGELEEQARKWPWPAAKVDQTLDTLYKGAKGRAEEYADLQKDRAALENTPGRKGPRVRRRLKKLAAEGDRLWEWFKDLDRRSYLAHLQAAAAVNPAWRTELADRYRFQVEVQRMFQEARHHQEKAFAFATHLFGLPQEQVTADLLGEVMQVLREARRALRKVLQDARDVNLPAMRNFAEGDRLADFILDEKLVAELPETYVKGAWVHKLLNQLNAVKQRCRRLHFKSLGGILELQERIAAAWRASRVPVEAVVLDDPPAAEVVEAELVEVPEAEPMVAMVADGEPGAVFVLPPDDPEPVFVLPPAGAELVLDLDAGDPEPAAVEAAGPPAVTKPARGGRPAVTITVARPGAKPAGS